MAKKIEVFVVVEGGGDQRVLDADFRRGYQTFLRKIAPDTVVGRRVALEVVRGKGRSAAYDKFCHHNRLHPDALILLLIDSENDVPRGSEVWPYLADRDAMTKPAWATEGHAYLMVQCVETWLVKDRTALRSVYGNCLKERPLPKRRNLEDEPKVDAVRKLKLATATCKEQRYEHGDSWKVMEVIDPGNLAGLPNADRLFRELPRLIEAFADAQ